MALDSSIRAVGSKQGAFKHVNPVKGRSGTSPVIEFTHSITAPRDAQSGLATGKRLHHPLSITKELDPSTINFIAALTTNETLSTVVINFYIASAAGLARPGASATEEKAAYTIELKNAVLSGYRVVQPNTRNPDPAVKNRNTWEVIDFTYQEITCTWNDGGLSTSDNWLDPAV
jgi:type VI secretion system secreted protein Hcp